MIRRMIALLAVAAAPCACWAADLYCGDDHVQPVDGTICLARHWEQVFAESFEGGLGDWTIANYEQKLSIALVPEGATGQGLLVTNRGATGDTAFEVSSRPIPIAGGATFALQFSWRSNRSLGLLVGHQGQYLTELEWLDQAAAPLDPLPFALGPAARDWQIKRLEGTAPANAAAVRLRFGFDHPNLGEGEYLALDDLRLEVRSAPATYEPSGWMLSRPLHVAGADRRLSWQADVPPGTTLRFQVASAPDDAGGPGQWSEPLGPNGAKDAWFSQPGPLPAVHAGRPWLRYLARLDTTVPGKTPALRSVRLGPVADGPWSGRDVNPPMVSERSATRTAEAQAPLWFRLSDETGIDPRSLRVFLDGQDITAKLARQEGRYTYTPPEPLQPRPAEAGLARWRVTNYGGALTVERTVRRRPESPPGVHLTREAGRADTAFSLRSPLIAVQPGAKYRLSFWTRHSMDLHGAMDGKGTWSGGVTWLGPGETPLEQRDLIDLGAANPEWHQQTSELTAPEGAAHAQIGFGFDWPDLHDGAFLDLSEVALEGPHPPAGGDEPNLHRVTVEAADLAGNSLRRDWYLLIREPRTQNVVTLRDDGAVLVGGKPFFPIGLYAVWKKPFNHDSFDQAFADLKAAGFNLAHTYSSKRGPDFREFYAAAQKHGIKLYVSSDAGANCLDPETVLWDVVREEGHPALLAWYLADDTASHVGSEELRDLSEAVHDVDPAHLTVQADGVGSPPLSRYATFVRSTDGLLPELYPIRDNGDTGVPRIIADMKTIQGDLAKAAAPPRTIWPIIQYFQGWGWPRYPTREELWAMSYLALIHGGNGITWYTYGGWGDNHGVTDTPEVWKNICDLAGELSRLQDVFLERTGPQPPAPQVLAGPTQDGLGYPSISFLLKEHAGRKYLITANSAKAEVTARFALAAGAKIDLPFESRQIAAEAAGFTDTFAPYQVHVYVWE